MLLFVYTTTWKRFVICFLPQLRGGKIKMRFHFAQVERESVGHSHPRFHTSFSSLSLWKFWMRRWRMDTGHEDGRQQGKPCVLPGKVGGGYFPYILSNEIETMFSQPVSWLWALRQTTGFCGRNKNIVVEGGTVSGNSQIYWFYVALQTYCVVCSFF